MSTTRGEILKAIMEGATFYFVEHLATLRRMGVDLSEFVVTGGGARSDAWMQIKADIMGVPHVRPAATECGLVGAAILAGVATAAFGTAAEGATRMVRTARVFEPDAKRHVVYQARYERYMELYSLMRGRAGQ
jgi:sugar (pentulose or hexulose) kinase